MMTQRAKKRKSVTIMRRGLPEKRSAPTREKQDEPQREMQDDPLKGKIREALPAEYLHRASRWYCKLHALKQTAILLCLIILLNLIATLATLLPLLPATPLPRYPLP